MSRYWLWGIPNNKERVKSALRNGENKMFLSYAAKLFAHLRSSVKAFRYVDKITFCEKWPAIKKLIQKNTPNSSAPKFWQPIYETIKNELKAKGTKIRLGEKDILPECLLVAEQIKKLRKEKNYTQRQLAIKMKIIQQYISVIESGRENFSVKTLASIAKALDKKLVITFA